MCPDMPQTGDGVVTETRRKVRKPPMYRVLLHNDDYTTMEFVVLVLVTVFRRDHTAAVRIMLSVHREGVGVAGVYTREVAEEKLQRAMTMARENGMPLQLSMQPER